MGSGFGYGRGVFKPDKPSGLVIPTTGPDSFGNGSSLELWVHMDHASLTLNAGDLESVDDASAIGAFKGRTCTGQVGALHGPASDQNGKNRFNAELNTEGLLLDPVITLPANQALTIAWYGRHYTTGSASRAPVLDTLGDVTTNAFALHTDSVNNGCAAIASDSTGTDVADNAISLNTHYVAIYTIDASGNMAYYRNGIDRTIAHTADPVGAGSTISYIFCHPASGAGWNFGMIMVYTSHFSDVADLNELGQYIDDYYGLGNTWALT